jgi:hypothetical protein
MKASHSIADLRAAKTLTGFGKIKTGSTPSVRYVRVAVSDPDRYPEALLVAYGSDAPVVINDAAKISQFLHRGC